MDASARHYSSYFSAIGCSLSLDSIRLAVVFLSHLTHLPPRFASSAVIQIAQQKRVIVGGYNVSP